MPCDRCFSSWPELNRGAKIVISCKIVPGIRCLTEMTCNAMAVFKRHLNSQPFTAFGPTPVDNSPAVLCLHSGPETMGAVPFEVAGLKSSLAHDRLPFSLLLRPFVGLHSFFAVLQQLEPCLTNASGNTSPKREKIRPAIKLAIVPRARRHVKHFPETVTVPMIPCPGRTAAGQKPA